MDNKHGVGHHLHTQKYHSRATDVLWIMLLHYGLVPVMGL